MNVDLMRKIDYYLGVPLSILASLIIKPIDAIRGKPASKPKKVLFVELSEMGSTILADPAMQRVKNSGAEIFFVIFKKNKPSLDLLQTVPEENIFTLDESSLFSLIADAIKFIFWCRKNKIEAAIDLELFSRVSTLLSGFSFARVRVGFHNFHGEGLYRGHLVTHKVAYNPHIHISKNFIALIHALEAEKVEVPFAKIEIKAEDIQLRQVSFSSEETQPIKDKITALHPDYSEQKLVLINPNASELLPQRRWPKDRYLELIKRLLETHSDILVLITGAPAEKDEAQELVNLVENNRCLNFAGQLKLQDMPKLYFISKLMVTNDSGPGHFSAITPLKTFVLFGPETPKLYGSLGNSEAIYAGLACSPCVSASNHRKTPCTEPVCMTAIDVSEVFDSVHKELATDTHG